MIVVVAEDCIHIVSKVSPGLGSCGLTAFLTEHTACSVSLDQQTLRQCTTYALSLTHTTVRTAQHSHTY